MSSPNTPKLIRVIAAVLVLAIPLLFVLLAPGRKRSTPSPKTNAPTSASSLETIKIDPPAEPPFKLENIRYEPRAIRFDIAFQMNAAEPTLAFPLIFAIPEKRAPRARLEAYSIAMDDRKTSDTRALESAAIANPNVTGAVVARGLGVMRRWNLCALDLKNGFFQPYASAPRDLRSELKASLVIEWDDAFEGAPNSESNDPHWDAPAKHVVANAEGLKLYAIAAPKPRGGIDEQPTSPWRTVPGERFWLRLSLREEGLYEVRMDDLLLAGAPSAELKPAAFRLFRRGEPMKLLRLGEGTAQRIFFWHTANTSAYSPEKVYFATLDESLPDPQIEPVSNSVLPGEPAAFSNPIRTSILDRDNKIMIESGNFLAIKSMKWVDAPITARSPLDVPLTLHGLAHTTDTIVASLQFHQEPPSVLPSYRLHLKKDGAVLGTMMLRAEADLTHALSLSLSALSDGANDLSLELDNLPEMKSDDARTTVWLDSVRLPYPSEPVLDDAGRMTLSDDSVTTGLVSRWTAIKEPTAFSDSAVLAIGPDGKVIGSIPVTQRDGASGLLWPAGHDYRVEATRLDKARAARGFDAIPKDDLAEPGDGCDLMIVTHHDFAEQATRLAELHQRGGLRVRVVDIQSVYDNFSSGDFTPHAIRNLLAHMLESWGVKAPGYVLLFGDCSSDYLGITRTQVRNFVPSFTYDAGLEDWASDYWFTTVTDDHLQDFMIGRISVATRDDARAIVDKIIKYSESANPGAWHARVAFVADDGGFVEPIEELRKTHTPEATLQRQMYLDEQAPLEDNMYLPSKVVREKRMKVSPVLTAQIREAFNGGVALMDYYGHGSPNIWMEERIWFGGDSANSDNQFLANSGHMAFVTTMTCNTGAIDYPVPKGLPGGGWNLCISEDMMRQPDGGAIALYVPSGPSVTGVQHQMSIELHRALFKDQVREIGAVQAMSTTRFLARGPEFDLAYMLIMLGDPAMPLQLAGPARTFTLNRKAWKPGESLHVELESANPNAGQFVAELRSREGNILAEATGRGFSNSHIPITLTIPTDCENTSATLSVYAWNPQSHADLTASAQVRIESPRLQLVSAVWNQSNVRVHVRNTGLVDGEATVSLHAVPSEGPALAETKALLSPFNESDLLLQAPSNSAADTLEVRLNASQATALRLMAPRSTGPPLIIPDASSRKPSRDGNALDLLIRARASAESNAADIVLADTTGTAIVRQPASAIAGGVEASFQIIASDAARATSGTLLLVPAGTDPLTTDSTLASIPLAAIPFDAPRLTIVPASVRICPPHPFEGQTLWIDFEIENRGRASVPSFNVGLYDGPPEVGSLLVPDHFRGTAQRNESAMEPGERRHLSLRADPVDNAGEMTWVLRLDPQNSRGTSTNEDLTVPIHLNIRRKADLKRGSTRMEEFPAATGKKSFVLKGEVSNEGGTDARDVMVVFFGSAIRSPENVLGRTLVPTIRAGEKLEVSLTLDEAMLKRLKDLGEAAQPNHQLVLNWRRSFDPEELARKH